MRIKPWMYSVFLVVQVFVLVGIFVRGKKGMQYVRGLAQDNQKTACKVMQLEHEIDCLQHEIDAWDADTFYKEKMAREQLHMARAGDVVYYR